MEVLRELEIVILFNFLYVWHKLTESKKTCMLSFEGQPNHFGMDDNMVVGGRDGGSLYEGSNALATYSWNC